VHAGPAPKREPAPCPTSPSRDDLEAPDAIAGSEPNIGHGFELGPTAGQLALDDLLACVDARIELGHEHFDRFAEAFLERVERADESEPPLRRLAAAAQAHAAHVQGIARKPHDQE